MGWSAGVTFAPVGPQLVMTLVCATVGAAVVLVASTLPAAFVQQVPGRGRWVEQGVYLTSSLPGVLVAFGILHLSLFLERRLEMEWLGVSVWDSLDRLGIFLLLGYVMRFLSQGYAAVRPAIGAVDLPRAGSSSPRARTCSAWSGRRGRPAAPSFISCGRPRRTGRCCRPSTRGARPRSLLSN